VLVSDSRSDRLEDLLARATSVPEDRRAQLIEQETRGDPALGAEALRLLQLSEGADEYIAGLRHEILGPDVEGILRGAAAEDGPESGGRRGSVPTVEQLNAALAGRYTIERLIGEGGMAAVYLARDVRHQRKVALKVLKPDLGALLGVDRFLSEIQVTANLQHPNLLPLFDSGAAGTLLFYVMPFVEGESLRARLNRERQLPVDEAVRLTTAIAGALDYAHRHGVVHRDLKPENILLHEGEPLVADFGVALALSNAGGTRMTRTGLSLGTPRYMSPEQVVGDTTIGPAADVWGLACLLYEMLGGEPPHDGATAHAILGKITTTNPDPVRQHRPTVPANVDAAIRKALERIPADRFRTAGEFAHALRDPMFRYGETRRAAPGRVRRDALAAALGAITISIVLAGGWALLGREADQATPALASRLLVDVRPADALLGSNPLERTPYGRLIPSRTAIALSPDGRTLAFTARRGERQSVYLRRLDVDEALELEGTEGADAPFFSPDGEFLGYWADGALWKVSLTGGPPVRLTSAGPVFSARWTEPERIVYAVATGIWSVSADGGDPVQLTELPSDGSEVRHMHAEILPGGRWLLYTVLPMDYAWDEARVVAQALDGSERKTVLEGAADARLLPTGHLAYLRLGDLMVAPFDAEGARVTGGEVGMVEEVMQSVNRSATPLDTGAGQYAVSASGTLAYVAGELLADHVGTLLWVHRDGTTEEIRAPTPERPFFAPRLAPDDRTLAVGTFGFHDHAIYRLDLETGGLLRLTHSGWATLPVWSPDGTRLAISFAEAGPRNLYSISSDGGIPQRLGESPAWQGPASWTPDGRTLVFQERGDIYVWSADSVPNVRALARTPHGERHVELSPDGRWLAFSSNETGRWEVYVASFPGLELKRPISTGGGVEPAWSGDGRTLAFLEPLAEQGFHLLVTDVETGETFTSGVPTRLFELPWYAGGVQPTAYDVDRTGERFLFVRETYPPVDADLDRIQIVLNWFDEVREREAAP
jgi:serine/threonine-protein kinase